MKTNTWAEGLNPTYARFDESQVMLYMAATMAKMKPLSDDGEKKVNEEFLIKILDKRIEVLKLPISFNTSAKLGLLALADRPGSVVVALIDCLNAYEGKTVTIDDLTDLYPMGFYDEETLMRYVDNYMKPKKVKWAEVY